MNFSNDYLNEKNFQKSKDFEARLTCTLNGLSNHCQVLQETKQEYTIFELPKNQLIASQAKPQILHSARDSQSSTKSIVSISAGSYHA
jgi:hypothetical protein